MAAATRIAQKHNMTLEEAARWQQDSSGTNKSMHDKKSHQRRNNNSDYSNLTKTQKNADAEKKRWQAAMDLAKERGLDRAENAKKAAQEAARERRSNSKSRRNPITHAKILLKETSLSFKEIADITGLDVYKIISMKLKSRSAA